MIDSFRKTRTFEQIAQTFTQAVTDLENLYDRNSDVMGKNTQTIDTLNQRNRQLNDENAKVMKFRDNLNKLLGE